MIDLPAPGARRLRLVAGGVLLALVLLTALRAPWSERLQAPGFDVLQVLAPRHVGSLSVTIVEIDQKSLRALGQWPWPRLQLARLVRTLKRAEPAAIGLNILMPEADALSPERLLAQAVVEDRTIAQALHALPSNDAELAAALATAPTVLVIAGTQEPSETPLRTAPITLRASATGAAATRPVLPQHAGALSSIDSLNRQASGWGLVSVDTTRGVVRRMPLVADVSGTLVPALAVEMLRVALRAPSLQLHHSGSQVTALTIGTLRVPTEDDGAVRVHFSRHRSDRFVSAIDVLEGRVDDAQLRGQLVLVAATATGLNEVEDTPLGERLSGSEIQAQLIESLVDGTLLRRPRWAPWGEAASLGVLGMLLITAVPRTRPARAALLSLVALCLPAIAALAFFVWPHWLLDAVAPTLYLFLLLGVLLVLTLVESIRQRRVLEGEVQTQRLHSARVDGELAAAQAIQISGLPRLDLLHGDRRVELYATLHAAREVGGDLYDFFMLGPDRLFVLVGDVAGKGLPASMFMAVSKALTKSAMLRAPDADLGVVMSQANAEVSRDNPQQLFVSIFAAVLDLRTGMLSYCNAGHDNPYRLCDGNRGAAHALARISDGDGPPLCAIADFAYVGASCQLLAGEMLCLMTDGVTEALNPAAELYGSARAQAWLERMATASAQAVVDGLHADVLAFADGADAADDLTILALRWRGPEGSA